MAGQILLYALFLAAAGSVASYLLYRHRVGVYVSLVIGIGSLIAVFLLLAVGGDVVSKLRSAIVSVPDGLGESAQRSRSPKQLNPFEQGTGQGKSERVSQLATAAVPRNASTPSAGADALSRSGLQPQRSGHTDASGDDRARPEPKSIDDLLRQGGATASAPVTGDMWSATKCVVPIRRDPEEPRRWTIVNDCGAPVAIVLASCESEVGECTRRASWVYSIDEIVFPAKYQRSVTEAEEIRYALHVDHAACRLVSMAAVRLVGMDDETRASPSWRDAFETATSSDACITAARGLLAAGMSTRQPPSTLLLPNSRQ